jgi:hypothetical protein
MVGDRVSQPTRPSDSTTPAYTPVVVESSSRRDHCVVLVLREPFLDGVDLVVRDDRSLATEVDDLVLLPVPDQVEVQPVVLGAG